MPTSSLTSSNYLPKATNGGREFAFVEVDVNGRVTDKNHLHTIRKHIMKDIGKARRKTIISTSEHQTKSIRRTFNDGPVHKTHGEDDSMLAAPQSGFLGSGRLDPFQCYPVPVDMEMLFLIDHLHTQSDPHLRPFKDIWYPISVSDPAFFYEILSNMSAHIFTLRNSSQNRDNCPQAINLHSRAINSVRTRLLDPILGISDGVIGTVLAFACFSHRANDWAEYDIHMEALHRIIEARGGVSHIASNPILRELISGVDLAGTCFLERPQPRFPLPTASGGGKTTTGIWPVSPSLHPDQSIWKHAFLGSSPLLPVFHDITTFFMILKSDLMRQLSIFEISIDPSTVRSLTDRLEEHSTPLPDITQDALLEECCRLAATVLLREISSYFKPPGSRSVDNHENRKTVNNVEKLHTILVRNSHYKRWLLFKPLLNWCVCLATVSTSSVEMKHGFLHLIVYGGRLMGLTGWSEALITAGNMLWVGEIFDERFNSITEGFSWESF
jgi:hypothetical protein